MGPTESDGDRDKAAERLARYRDKRSASATSEPFGGGRPGGGHLFVVQKHRASSLHWDLRLEMDGVLVSWAVPKGPSPNQADKRLAVHVEDHPLEYADFEGAIPEGSYGAGPSIVWDRGLWTAVEDPVEGIKKGKLLFDLKGYKLRGRWTLVKTKGGADNHWLLIKERDAYENPEGGTGDYPDDSILSGLTVEELGAGGDFGARIRERSAAAGAVRAALTADVVQVMNAEPCEAPFSRAGWVFEIKYDGYRLLGEAGGGQGEAHLAQRQRPDPGLSRGRAGIREVAVPRGDPRRRSGGERRRGTPLVSVDPEAGAAPARGGHRAGRGHPAGDLLRIRPARLRGI